MFRTAAIIAFALVSTAAISQTAVPQQQQSISQIIEQRLRAQIGDLTVNNIALATQLEIMQAQIAALPERIKQETAVLKAENEELKRQLEAAKTAAK